MNFGFAILDFGLRRRNMDKKLIPSPNNRKFKIQNLKWLGLSIFAFVLVVAGTVAHAQQTKKVSRIGFLNVGTPATSPTRQEVFQQSLRDLGYIEGQNIVIEWRYAEGKPDRLRALAAELVRLNVDIIVTGGGISTRSAK